MYELIVPFVVNATAISVAVLTRGTLLMFRRNWFQGLRKVKE
jgi:hypothetical protein